MLQIHVVLSLIGMVSGLVVLYGLLTGRSLELWTAIFLVTTILTSITGFPLEPFLAARNDPALRARLGLAPDDFVIGKIARLFQLKGHDDLLDLAPEFVKKCPRAKFLFVGGGEWRERLEKRARDLGLARHFIFAGLVPPEEVVMAVDEPPTGLSPPGPARK